MTEQVDFDSEIARALSEQRGQIVQNIVAGAVNSIQGEIGWKVKEAVAKEVGEWIEKEVLPEVRQQLVARRAEVILQVVAGIEAAFKVGADALAKIAAERLGSSWNVQQLSKALFG
jgi:hypothetical protein